MKIIKIFSAIKKITRVLNVVKKITETVQLSITTLDDFSNKATVIWEKKEINNPATLTSKTKDVLQDIAKQFNHEENNMDFNNSFKSSPDNSNFKENEKE